MQVASKACVAERERICKAQGVAIGVAIGMAKALTLRFLKTAKQRFQGVPKDLTYRLRGKSADQIDALYDLMLAAPDIDSVLSESSQSKRKGKFL